MWRFGMVFLEDCTIHRFEKNMLYPPHRLNGLNLVCWPRWVTVSHEYVYCALICAKHLASFRMGRPMNNRLQTLRQMPMEIYVFFSQFIFCNKTLHFVQSILHHCNNGAIYLAQSPNHQFHSISHVDISYSHWRHERLSLIQSQDVVDRTMHTQSLFFQSHLCRAITLKLAYLIISKIQFLDSIN